MSKQIDDRLDDLQARREGRSGETGGETMRVPVNMYEAEDALVVVAPLPGVKAQDITVEVEGSQLHIAAAMRSAAAKDYLVHEWHYGPFARTVDLPDGFGAGGTATHGNGLLAVRLTRGSGAGPVPVKPA